MLKNIKLHYIENIALLDLWLYFILLIITLVISYIYIGMFFNLSPLSNFYIMFFDILEKKKKDIIEKVLGKNIFNKMKSQSLEKRETNIKHEQTIGGLYNSGNSCYINCILQSFASLNELEHILEKLSKEHDNPIASATFSIIFKLNHSSSLSRTHSTSKLVKTLSLHKKIFGYEQQDAQEFFQILTTQLNAEILKMSKKYTEKGFSDSIKTRSENFDIKNEIKSPFNGLMANRLECMSCGFSEGIIHSLFTSVSLPLSSKELCSLEDCLSEYVNKEMIEDILCQKCSLIASKNDLEFLLKSLPDSEISQIIRKKLNAIISALETEMLDADYLKEFKLPRLVNSVKSKQIMFARLPKILTLHINRSSISPVNGSIYKNTAPITFPLILDLNKYTTSYSTLWTDPLQTMSMHINQKKSLKYELKSIIVHYGSHTSGHYVTFRKTPKGWFKISDRNVRESTIEEVLQSGNVFMLMYEKLKDNLNINQIIQNFKSENYTKPCTIKYFSSVFNNENENYKKEFQTKSKTQNLSDTSTINDTNYLYPIMKTSKFIKFILLKKYAMFQVHKQNKHFPTLKKILIGGIAAFFSKVFGKCISLSGSTSCPSFNTSLISTSINNTFPFLSSVSTTKDFDRKFESYIRENYTIGKYGNYYKCLTENILNIDDFYARYTRTVLCASIVQESIIACNLTAADSPPICADTCAEWVSSQALILQRHCTNRTLKNDLSLIRVDFEICTSPSASFSLECIKGRSNEPQSCGFGTNILGLCQYCNSFSQDSIDTCCIVSNLSQCSVFNYSTSVNIPSYLIPNSTTSASLLNVTNSSSLPVAPINKQEKNIAGLSKKTISFIIILSIIIVLIILSLLILLIILSYTRRRNKDIISEQLNNLNQIFSRNKDLHKDDFSSFFKTNSSALNYNSVSAEKNPDHFNAIIPVDTEEKMHPFTNNENKQIRNFSNFYNIANLSKSYKSQNPTSFSLNLNSYRTLNHHSSQMTENNPGTINTSAFRSSKSRPASSIGEDRISIFPTIMSMKDYYSDHQITRNTEVVALYMYKPKMPDEMTLEKGDIIHVVSVWDDGWCSGIKTGKMSNFDSEKNTSKDDIEYLENINKNASESKTQAQTDELIIKVFPLVCVCHKDSWKKIVISDISPSSTLKSAPLNTTHRILHTSENNIALSLNEKNIRFGNIEHDIKITKEIRRKSFPEIWSVNKFMNSKFKEQFEVNPS
ncbi:hypothetical protein PORY_000407 [Pneumocystis oryctolagi]|uniref:Uncharacterized protein n=1 Tax=Pneumocystis oryctolagi TaxID=42067 RepID=A0ACB7CH21_9ASCO|nr:hypothetical protein PORY_000407 [Pneumocystis oryctolagi]